MTAARAIDLAWHPFSSALAREVLALPGAGGRREGTLVKLDVSGFTALSEAFAAASQDGAEDLNDILCEVFDRLVDVLADHGGDVVQFGGDALTVWFGGDGHAGRGSRAAEACLRVLADRPPQGTPAGPVRLSLSAGAASGEALAVVVGRGQRDLVLLGPVVSACLRAEQSALDGTLVVAPSTGGDGTASRPVAAPGGPLPPAPGPSCWVPARVRGLLGAGGAEAGALSGEHRTAAVAFLQLVGSDAGLSRGRDAAETARVRRLVDDVEDVLGTTGVTWTATDLSVDGATLLLFAGAPLATEHDPHRLLRSVHEVLARQPDTRVRAGAHVGRVFAGVLGGRGRRTWAAIGDTTNVAARLLGTAPRGGARVSAALWEAATGRPPAAVEELAVRGRREPLRTTVLDLARPVLGPARPAAALAVVGRDEEVRRLAGALEATAAGVGGAHLLVGPPGAGKSTVVAAALDAAGAGLRVLALESSPYDATSSWSTARAGLRRLLGDDPARLRGLVRTAGGDGDLLPLLGAPLGLDLPPTAATRALDPAFVARVREDLLVRLLLADEVPLLVLAEDSHLADRSSLGLLDALAAASREHPVRVVAASRWSPGDPEGPAGWPGDPGAWEVMAVGPLPAAAARQVVLAAAGDRALDDLTLEGLVAESGGNPLFARELATLVAQGGAREGSAMPGTVEAVVAARIDSLPPSRRRLLREMAVAGAEARLDVLAEVLGPDGIGSGAWGDLDPFVELHHGHDGGQPASVRFRHDLYRLGAYRGLPSRRRRDLHGRLAVALAARGADPAVRAVHHDAAGQPREAAGLALEAARAAAAAGAWPDALPSYRLARSAGARAAMDPGWTATAAEEEAVAAEVVGRYEEAEQAVTEALRLQPGERACERLVARAAARERLGRLADALEDLDRALEAHGGDPARRAAVDLRRSSVLYRTGRLHDSLQLARAVAAADGVPALGRAQALLRVEMCCSELGLPGREEAGREALAAFEGLEAGRDLAILVGNLGATAYETDDWDLAMRRYTESAERYARSGDLVGAAIARNNAAEVLCEQGRDAEARALFLDVRRTFRAAGHAFGAACTASSLARIALRSGEPSEAAALLAEAGSTFRRIDAPAMVADTLVRQVELALVRQDGTAPEQVRLAQDAAAAADGGAVLEVALARVDGLSRWQSGDEAAARSVLAGAAALAQRTGCLHEEGQSLHALGLVDGLDAAGRGRLEEIDRRLGIVGRTAYPAPDRSPHG